MASNLIWETVKENRDSYLVEYRPPMADIPFASLHLIFLKKPSNEKVADLMESEFNTWLERYKVPIMVSSFDETGAFIYLKGIRSADSLIGFKDDKTNQVSNWWEINDEKLPKEQTEELRLKKIYIDIRWRTTDQVRQSAIENNLKLRRGTTIFIGLMVFWAALPVTLDLLSYKEKWEWVAYFFTAYSLFQFFKYFLKLVLLIPIQKTQEKSSFQCLIFLPLKRITPRKVSVQ